MLAVIEKSENGYIAQFERQFDHSVEEVWSWLTDNEKLAKWFNELRVGELREGGFMKFDMGDGTFEKMAITDLKDQSVLEFTWGSDMAVRFELSTEAPGCKLILIEKIEKLTPHTLKDLAGWHVCLDVIKALMEGETIERMEEWKKWYEEYKQAARKVSPSQ